MKLALVVGVIALGLVGCVSPQQRAQQAAVQAAQVEATQDHQCRSFGAQPGTEVYYNCRMQLQAQAAAAQAAQAAAMNQAIIRSLQPTPQPYYLPTPK